MHADRDTHRSERPREPWDLSDDLTDDALVTQLRKRLAHERRTTAEVLRLMAEVDRRRLYARFACDSMFAFATRVLGMSESAAYKRIRVARAARQFSSLLERVGTGQLHLSGLCVLVPHLTCDNQRELLDAATGLGRRQIEQLVAARFPKPDVATSVRKLPTVAQPLAAPDVTSTQVTAPPSSSVLPAKRQTTSEAPEADTTPTAAAVQQQGALAATSQARPIRAEPAGRSASRAQQQVQPLSADRYLLKVSVSAQLRDKLRQSQDLLRGQLPDGDIAAVLDCALDALIAAQLKKKYALGAKPRRAQPAPHSGVTEGSSGAASATTTTDRPRSRAIPAAIRRAVYQRDDGQCRFVDTETGLRCQARAQLQFHHDVPFARGGQHSISNIMLMCAAHNAYLARRDYGHEHIEAAIASRTAKAARPAPAPRASSGPPTRPGDSAALPVPSSKKDQAATEGAAQSPVESSPASAPLARRSQSCDHSPPIHLGS